MTAPVSVRAGVPAGVPEEEGVRGGATNGGVPVVVAAVGVPPATTAAAEAGARAEMRGWGRGRRAAGGGGLRQAAESPVRDRRRTRPLRTASRGEPRLERRRAGSAGRPKEQSLMRRVAVVVRAARGVGMRSGATATAHPQWGVAPGAAGGGAPRGGGRMEGKREGGAASPDAGRGHRCNTRI